MKKKIMLLCTLLVLCFTTICSASSNSSLLNSEEKVADKVLAAISGKSAYADVLPSFSAGLAKNLSEKKFAEMKTTIKTQLGNLSDPKLAVLQKFDNADRLIFVAKGSKVEAVELVFTFDTTAKSPSLNEIAMRPLEVQKQAPAKK